MSFELASAWDIDNCLANDAWRTPLIDWHLEGNLRYERYDALMDKDSVAHFEVWSIITKMTVPIFITGRREKWRSLTERWLKQRLPVWRDGRWVRLQDPLILMRPDECDDRPAELKEKLLLSLPDHGWELSSIMAAFDDVQSIVDMYHRHGVPAAVLRIHNPELAYSAKDL